MPSETDLIKLYSGKILKMAAEPIYRERLSEPDASVTKDHHYVDPQLQSI